MEKLLYKLTLICVKYIPVLLALVDVVVIVLSYFNIYPPLLGVILGSTVLTLIPMYITSFAFKFCKYHRMILNYLATNKLIYILDYLFVIPLSDIGFVTGSLIIAAIFLTLTIYYYLKYGDRSDT